MAARKIIFEELGEKERVILLRAFDYDVDKEGYVLDSSGSKVRSEEKPSDFLLAKDAMLVNGSLKVLDSTPTAISKFIREESTSNGNKC